MALGQDLPHSFESALRMTRRILGRNLALVEKGLVEAESEQLVIAAYRQAGGNSLSRVEFFSRLRDRFPEDAGKRLIVIASQRASGRILQHLTGYQHFLNHEYEVSPAALVPRPETEVLATLAIQELRLSRVSPQIGLEIGIGSGVLSVELLSNFPGLQMLATEASGEAEKLACRNAEKILGKGPSGNPSDRLKILRARHFMDVFGPFAEALESLADFLISNPPYLSLEDPIDSEVSEQEPRQALFAPQGDPLFYYREIAEKAGEFVKPGGWVFLEIPHHRADQILKVFSDRGWNARYRPDLNQRPRVLIASQIERKNG